jgi:hypothetical protein
MPRPKGEPMRVGDVWHARCGRVYTPAQELWTHFDPECSDEPSALWDWINGVHDDGRGVLPTFCVEQQMRDAGVRIAGGRLGRF